MGLTLNSIFLNLANTHRRRASDELFGKGKLSDEMVALIKTDIVNLTNLKNPTAEDKEEAEFNIKLMNMILDKYYDLLYEGSPDEEQSQLSFKFTNEVKHTN